MRWCLLFSLTVYSLSAQAIDLLDRNEKSTAIRYIDREIYVGVTSSFILTNEQRHAGNFVASGEFHWGMGLTLDDSFEAALYNYTYKENKVLRDDRNDQSPAKDNYIHTGMRGSWIHYTKDGLARLYPVYEKNAKLIPYWSLGFALEPIVRINDAKVPQYDGDSFWGIGFQQAMGYLNILPRSNWRIRYELGVLESYTPTVSYRFFFEPFIRVKLEYAFSLKRAYKPVEVSVTSNPPLFPRDNKTLDELIAEKEGAVVNFQFKKVIEKNKIASSNIENVRDYTINFRKQSELLALKGIINLNKISADRKAERKNGKEQVYMVRGYAKFLEHYLDLRPDLPMPERRAYITKRLNELARRRALLVSEFLIDNGIPKENIGLRWVVIPEDRELDGVLVTAYIADHDIIISQAIDTGDEKAVAPTSKSFRNRYTTVGDITFDLSKQEKGKLSAILEGNSIALDDVGDALAAETAVQVVTKQPPPMLTESATANIAEALAAETAAIALDEEALAGAQETPDKANNIYQKYAVTLDTDTSPTGQEDAFIDNILVDPLNTTQADDQDDVLPSNLDIPRAVLLEQRTRAKARDRLFIFFVGNATDWTPQSQRLLDRLFTSDKITAMQSVTIRAYNGDGLALVDEASITKLEEYVMQRGVRPTIVNIWLDDQPIGAQDSPLSPADYRFVAEIIVR